MLTPLNDDPGRRRSTARNLVTCRRDYHKAGCYHQMAIEMPCLQLNTLGADTSPFCLVLPGCLLSHVS